MAASAPRRFAALKDATSSSAQIPALRGMVFDMDGTLCLPQTYMFGEMRSALGISKSVDILEHVESLPVEKQPAAYELIKAIERKAMESQTPQPGLSTLMSYLDSRGVRKAICTRNFDLPVQNLLSNFLPSSLFHPIVTREFKPAKPDPAGILHIAKNWGLEDGRGAVDASGLIMVGDSIDDIKAGRAAGAATVLIVNDVNQHLADHGCTDLVVERLDELVDILERGFHGRDIIPDKVTGASS